MDIIVRLRSCDRVNFKTRDNPRTGRIIMQNRGRFVGTPGRRDAPFEYETDEEYLRGERKGVSRDSTPANYQDESLDINYPTHE